MKKTNKNLLNQKQVKNFLDSKIMTSLILLLSNVTIFLSHFYYLYVTLNIRVNKDIKRLKKQSRHEGLKPDEKEELKSLKTLTFKQSLYYSSRIFVNQ